MAYENKDLFFLLPEALLITILSFLPLKDAVRTSVLTKYWRDLWCSRPNIELNANHFSATHLLDENQQHQLDMNEYVMLENKKCRQNICLQFGYWWLSKDTIPPHISSFTLTLSDPQYCLGNIQSLVYIALFRRTKSLELDFSSLEWEDQLPRNALTTPTPMFDLPQFVYQYPLLESLKLVTCRFMGDMFKVLGTSLRCISLGWIEITNASKLSELVKSCPLLESLTLFKCFQSTYYVIESLSLKMLVIDKCVDLLSVSIDTPNLTYFKYCGEVVQFGVCNFPNLKTANIDFGLVEMMDEVDGDKIAHLLHRLYFATSLTVCGFVTQALTLADEEFGLLPGQYRARSLTIKTAFHVCEFHGILSLLNAFGKLEKVRFEFGNQIIFEEDMEFLGYCSPPTTFWSKVLPSKAGCVIKKLKTIEIVGYRGTLNETNLISFILCYGHAFQTLILRVASNDQQAKYHAMCMKKAVLDYRKGFNVEVLSY